MSDSWQEQFQASLAAWDTGMEELERVLVEPALVAKLLEWTLYQYGEVCRCQFVLVPRGGWACDIAIRQIEDAGGEEAEHE